MLTDFLQNDLRRVLLGHINTAATEAGKAQAIAFGKEVVTPITQRLAAGVTQASSAAAALESAAQRLTWKSTRRAAGIAAGCGLGIIIAAIVVISKKPTMWGSLQNENEVYVVPVGY